MNGAQMIVGILEREGIDVVAGIPGGSNLPLYDALRGSALRHILVRHEQAAGFLAQGMARATGKAAACFATSGPGATNLLTAIADAKLDSIPLVAVTGQVPRAMLGTDAFQEIDTYGLSIPIAKHSVLVRSARELLEELPKAFEVARSGRPGPVVVDVPKDVQAEAVEIGAWPAAGVRRPDPAPDAAAVEKALALIDAAERPLVYAGAGCAASEESAAALAAFARTAGIPVATTLLALGAFPCGDPLYLGMLGMHGTRCANRAVGESDLLVVAGARFDDRATGAIETFAPGARIVHIDLDAAELGKLRKPDVALRADAGAVLRLFAAAANRTPSAARRDWLGRVAELKAAEIGPERAAAEHPARFLHDALAGLPADSVVATDVGQHQMWTAQAYRPAGPRRFLTSGGLGTMGFGLPAAIGAALARPSSRVVCVTGDGSLLMNVQELATLAETRARVAILVVDNGRLGLVRQQQEFLYGGRYSASSFSARPDFALLARAFGIPAVDLERERDPIAAFREAASHDGPILVRYPADAAANAFPMVPAGAPTDRAVGFYEEDSETA